MAEIKDAVMDLVEAELKKDPDAGTDELYELAIKKDPDIAELSKRQFNARYPLQVKRRRSLEETAAEAEKKPVKKKKAKKSAAKKTEEKKKAKKPAAKKVEKKKKKAAPASKRKAAAKRPAKSTTPAAGEKREAAPVRRNGARDQVRSVLMEFAKEMAKADDRTSIVEVMAGIDNWVDKIEKAHR